MDDVAVSLICDVVDNFDGEIETFFGNENNFDFVAIAGVSCCFVRRNLTRIQNYFERTVPSYFGDEFAAHFRMTRTTAELLTTEVIQTGKVPTGNPFGRPTIPPEKQVLVFLWAMATQEGTREIADRFDITYSSVSRTVVRVMEAVCGLKNQYIRWPNGNEINEIKADFGDTFPGIIGAIDATLIHIRCPSENKEAYNCRKRFPALNIQVVCDNQMEFRDVLAGWPGSVHDSRILRNSFLWQNSDAKFPGDTHLLGDGGYPLTTWLMVPYRDNGHLTRQQIRFNEALSTQRQVIERAIGLLKGRW